MRRDIFLGSAQHVGVVLNDLFSLFQMAKPESMFFSKYHCTTVIIIICSSLIEYANNLEPDQTPSNSASDPEPSCLIIKRYFLKTMTEISGLLNIQTDEG